MITIPDELVEHVKSVTPMEVETFFINAARKELRHLRARQLREEYERTHRHRTPQEVYEQTLAEIIAFETKYGVSSDQFLRDFETGVMDEDPTDWVAFYRWRTLVYGLRQMEHTYGLRREAKTDAGGQT
jgi:hypothetical protein